MTTAGTQTTTTATRESNHNNSNYNHNNNKVRFANSTGRPRRQPEPQQQQQQQQQPIVASVRFKQKSMDSSSSDMATPSMYDTSTSESWSTSDGRTPPSYHAPSYYSKDALSSSQRQAVVQQQPQMQQNRSQQQQPHQRYQTPQPQQHQEPKSSLSEAPNASPNTSLSSASTKLHQNKGNRPDYSRSQPDDVHTPTTASEPGTIHERFIAAYLSRLAVTTSSNHHHQDSSFEEETAALQRQHQLQSRQVYGSTSSKVNKVATSLNHPSESAVSKNRFLEEEKKESSLSATTTAASKSSTAAVAPSIIPSSSQEHQDATAPGRSTRLDRRARLEKLSHSIHARTRSSSRSITPNREPRIGTTTTTSVPTTPNHYSATNNKQAAWRSTEAASAKPNQQQQQHLPQLQPPKSKLTVVTTPQAPASPTEDQIQKGNAVIETPSPAKVEDLKRQLWSENEQLKNWSQVVDDEKRRLIGGRPRHAKSLSPDRPQYRKNLRSERVAAAFLHNGGGGSSSDNEAAPPRVSHHQHNHHHDSNNLVTRSSHSEVQDSSYSPSRVFRSRFYAAAIAAHRGKEPQTAPSASAMITPTYQATHQHHHHHPGINSNPALTTATAASKAVAVTPKASTSQTPTSKQEQRQVTPKAPSPQPPTTSQQQQNPQQQQQQDVSMWRQVPAAPALRNDQDSIPIAQSSSTATTSDNYVAKLVAKLSAVRRDNPSAALAQIDAILRAESQSSSGERQDTVEHEVVVEEPKDPVAAAKGNRGIPEEEEEEESEDDTSTSSEDETTVSSITNPTFQSLRQTSEQGAPVAPHPSLHAPLPRKLHASEVQGYLTPYTMQQPKQHPWEAPREKSLKPKKTNTTPPPSIRVTSLKEKTRERPEVDPDLEEATAAARRLDRFIQKKHSSSLDPNNPAELAEKIRVWDEMSNPSLTQTQSREYQMSSGGVVVAPSVEEVLSNATEDLGSIITPADQASNTTFTGSKLTGNHPWDNCHPTVRAAAVMTKDTSMLDGEGIETQAPQWRNHRAATAPGQTTTTLRKFTSSTVPMKPSTHFDGHDDNSFAARLDDRRPHDDTWDFPSPSTQEHQVNAMSLSDEFDNAWVSLPPNAFFGRNGRARRPAPPQNTDLLTTTMFPATASTDSDRWKQQQQQQQQKPSLLPPDVTAAFEQVSLATPQPRLKGQDVNPKKTLDASFDTSGDESKLLLLKDDPWLFAKDKDVSGESHRSAGIEVSLMEESPPPTSSQTPSKSNKARLSFLRPMLSRGRASQPTRNDGGNQRGAYGSLSPKPAVLRHAQAANNIKSPQRDNGVLSPPRGRSNSFEEMGSTATGTKLKNKTLAKKFSRLMKVYDDKPEF